MQWLGVQSGPSCCFKDLNQLPPLDGVSVVVFSANVAASTVCHTELPTCPVRDACTHSISHQMAHCGLPQFHAIPQRPQPLERDQYFNRMGPVKLHLNKDHTLVGDPKSPPCCIHLKGSAVMIQTIWGGWMDLQRPGEEAGHPRPQLTAPFFVFLPLLGQAAFLRCPGDLCWRR